MRQLLTIGLCVAAIGTARAGLYEDFVAPPDEVKVGCYYYWVNERVDPVGVRKDLEWMKANGITRAFLATDIRNHDEGEFPGQIYGDNEFWSETWWANLRTALWMAGNDANQYGGYRMGVYKGTGNNVVFAYTWYAKDGDIMASPLATAEVADISSKFHTYAIVKKSTKDSDNKYDFEFYVDGESVSTATQFFDTLTGVFQFGAGYGKDAYKADGAELDDWRMFSRELSAEEIRQYHERFREHTGLVIIISDATLEVPTTWGGVSGMEEDVAEAALVAENSYGVKGYEAYLLGYDDIESANRVMDATVSGGNVLLSFAGAGTPPASTGVTVTYKAQYRESMTDGDWADYPADSEDEHYVATSTDGTVSMAFAKAYAYTRLVAVYE